MTTTSLPITQVASSHSEPASVRVAMRMLGDILLILAAFAFALGLRAYFLEAMHLDFSIMREIRNAQADALYLTLFMACYLWVAWRAPTECIRSSPTAKLAARFD